MRLFKVESSIFYHNLPYICFNLKKKEFTVSNFQIKSKFCGHGVSLVQRGSWGSGQPYRIGQRSWGFQEGSLGSACMASLWNLDACTAWLAQKFPGIPKTSNQFYRAVLTPRNLAAPVKVHDHKNFDQIIKLHTVNWVRNKSTLFCRQAEIFCFVCTNFHAFLK